jgi:SpoVK/Ycf46/Vps4 family AAA+-type ATPase
MPRELPSWAKEMREIFRSGTTSQFVIHGNVFDLVPAPDAAGGAEYMSLQRFLTETMFAPFDVVVQYDRGKGIRVRKGGDAFHRFLKAFDSFQGTSWASLPDVGPDRVEALDLGNLLPRDPKRALELIDRFIRGAMARTRLVDGKPAPDPLKVAVIIDYAHFLAPQGEPLYVSDLSQTLIQLLDWAADPAIAGAYVATVLTCENLSDLNRLLVETPYSAKVKVELPNVAELKEFVADVTVDVKDFTELCEVSRDSLAEKVVGLSRVNVRNLIRRALSSRQKITLRYLTDAKREYIEKEAFGKLEFLETDRTLDDVAGHVAAKAWLRQDAVLLKRGVLRAIPMGYLLTGRIGTGKTFLVECLAGEIGVPCVEMKNFREKWVGSTEGNLEKVFSILHALGQVIVFVDEADQAMGKRSGGDSDSGLSGRIYAMMAKEMSDTRNRGKIIWIFATSRPDLLEVDLKRQGRLDVHIPLFPPTDPAGRRDLFAAMARKLKMPVKPDDLPELPDNDQIGGNEMEGILVRALRDFETAMDAFQQRQASSTPAQPPQTPPMVAPAAAPAQTSAPAAAPDAPPSLRPCIEAVIADVRPSAHTERLELMDLVAVKECTDTRFLPERYRAIPIAEVNQRIERLKLNLGE